MIFQIVNVVLMKVGFVSCGLYNVHLAVSCTETERSSGWQPWYSLETLKASFNVSSEYQGCHPEDISVCVCTDLNIRDHSVYVPIHCNAVSHWMGAYTEWSLILVGHIHRVNSGPSFIKPDQLDPWIKDQLRNALLSTILSLQLPNFVSFGKACPSHMTQNLVTVGAKSLTGEWF